MHNTTPKYTGMGLKKSRDHGRTPGRFRDVEAAKKRLRDAQIDAFVANIDWRTVWYAIIAIGILYTIFINR